MKTVLAALAAFVFALFGTVAMADEPTVTLWGCEWKQAANGNYWTKVDGGCAHWEGQGYDRLTDTLGVDRNKGEEPGEEPKA